MTQPIENNRRAGSAPPRAGGMAWFVAALVLVIAGIVLPYGVMAGTALAAWTFVFWTVFGLVTVAVIAWGVMGWRERE
jgi:hypothetical protein